MSKFSQIDQRWKRTIPIVFVTYSLAYLDRVNFGFAAAAGMGHDLGITAQTSSLLGALFFFAYFLFQIPGTIYAEKRSVKKLIFWCLLAWAGLVVATGLVKQVPSLMVIRFLLGVSEAAVMPALLVLLNNWFSRSERSRANTFLILGNPLTIVWMSIVSGYLVHAFDWRWMFILEGIPAALWAIAWWFWVDDLPSQAKWLDPEERQRLEAAQALDQKNLKPVRNYAAAFRSPLVIVLAAQYFFWSIGVYGFVLWLPSILRLASNLTIVNTGWLSALPYLVAAPSMLLVSFRSDKMQNRKAYVWPCLLVAGLAFFASYLLGANHFWLSYASLIVAAIGMYAPYGPFFAIIPEILPSNVAGGAAAMINSLGALGGFVGAYFVGYLNGLTGSNSASFALLSLSFLVAAFLSLFLPGGTKRPPIASELNLGARAAG